MHIVPLSVDIDPTLAIRDADIKRAFTAQTLSAGRSYEQRGRVQELQISSAGAVISALTQGTQPDPYVQNLRVARLPSGGVKIIGACSCPVRAQCKHVAAVAIAAQRRESVLAKSAAAPASSKRMTHGAAVPEAPQPAAKSSLPVQIRDWLSGFDGEDDELTEDYPSSVRTRIYYVLASEPAHPNGAVVPRLLIDPMSVTLRKDGSAGSIRRYAPHQVQTPAKYLRPSDLVILSRLSRRASGLLARADDDPVDTLRRILVTGRARWGNAEGPTVTEGAERPGQITWITRPDASQQASLSVDEGLTAVRLPQPWYVDTTAGNDRSDRLRPAGESGATAARRAAHPARGRRRSPHPARQPHAGGETAGAQRVAARRDGAGNDAPASAPDQRRAADGPQLRPRQSPGRSAPVSMPCRSRACPTATATSPCHAALGRCRS